nr:MAG TPA: YvrJ protein family protein [Bacteriophage sp.]
MDIDAIVSLIGSVGFPIVACVAMGVFCATQFKDYQDMLQKNNLLTEELVVLLKRVRDREEVLDEANSQPRQ